MSQRADSEPSGQAPPSTGEPRYMQARLEKDASFDGRFFFGVKTTGIFCRPSCPARVAKEENVRYFATMYAALEAGFTPCYRCRPDIDLGFVHSQVEGAQIVQRAMSMIDAGWLNNHSVGQLAAAVGRSERQLRQLFSEQLGISPLRAARYSRAVFAKRLILQTQESFTNIAFAAGFSSIRQFNDTVKQTFKKTPSALRANANTAADNPGLPLHGLDADSFRHALGFMRPREIPGVEQVGEASYARSFRTEDGQPASFRVQLNPVSGRPELRIDGGLSSYMPIYHRVRRMFGLEHDMGRVAAQLQADPLLFAPGQPRIVPRLPVAFDAFEFIIRAILGQQISVKAATTIAGRVVQQANLPGPAAGQWLFPRPAELLALDLTALGVTRARAQTLRSVAEAVHEGRLPLNGVGGYDAFSSAFLPIKGIGPWTVEYAGMRALGLPDCFPVSDLGLIKMMATKDGARRTQKQMSQRAERWRPYRSFAAMCLWRKLEAT